MTDALERRIATLEASLTTTREELAYLRTQWRSLTSGGVFTYVARSGCEVKIGRTGNLHARLHSLRTARPDIQLAVVAFADVEGLLHARFSAQRTGREWFITPVCDVVAALDAMQVEYSIVETSVQGGHSAANEEDPLRNAAAQFVASWWETYGGTPKTMRAALDCNGCISLGAFDTMRDAAKALVELGFGLAAPQKKFSTFRLVTMLERVHLPTGVAVPKGRVSLLKTVRRRGNATLWQAELR